MTQSPQKKRKIQFQLGWGGLFAIFTTSLCVLLWVFILGFWFGQKMVHRGSPQPAPETLASLPAEKRPVPPLPPKAPETTPLAPPASDLKAPVQAMPPVPPQQDTEVPREAKEEAPAPPPLPSPVVEPKPEPPREASPPPAETKGPPVASTSKKQPSVPPATAPAKAKGTKDEVYFTLQIASFRDRAQAEQEARKWSDKGYRARAKGVDLGAKGTWYRVYVGRFETLEEAQAFERIITKKERVKTYIVSVKD